MFDENELKKFWQEVQVQLENDEICEFEVSKAAMNSYNKYDFYNYKKWKPEKNNNKYYLVNEDIKLTADILTSIKTPYNKTALITENPKWNGTGGELRKFITEGFNEQYEVYRPFINSFALVYYWIGNMIPVVYNFRCGANDNWNYKLCSIKKWFEEDSPQEESYKIKDNLIKQIEEGKNSNQNDIFLSWIRWMKINGIEEFESFVGKNFLHDMVDKTGNVKSIKKLQNEEDIKGFWLTNTKLIIQRSYRIKYVFKGDWDEKIDDMDITHGYRVISIFEEVLKKAGFSEEVISTMLDIV